MWQEGLDKLKKLITSYGIELVTFLFVAQNLKRLEFKMKFESNHI
jgi:hypothetical protein